MASGRRDLIIDCECGAGICTVGPLIYNQQCLFICCPKGLANGSGCGFMQWRDPNKTTTRHSHNNLPHPPPLFTTTVAIAEEYTLPFTAAEEDTPPPPPPQTTAMMCPCCAGPCFIGTAKNGYTFYSCSCFICREEGHWYMDCPQLLPFNNKKMICFYCKLEGHYVSQCHSKFRRRRRN